MTRSSIKVKPPSPPQRPFPRAKKALASEEKCPAETKSPTALRVRPVDADLELSVPNDCSASVLLKHVTTETSPQGARLAVFTYWMLVGRHGLLAAAARYRHQGGGVTLRVDVPRATPLTSEYLLEQLLAYWKQSGNVNLPPDTPVIKG